MEKQTGLVNQISRVLAIKTAIEQFDAKEESYQLDLNEINKIIANAGDAVISRLRDKINFQDMAWDLTENGCFEISERMEGYLPDLNDLTDLIVISL